MEEKQEKKQEPELKGKMGIVWLVGILVILLGCVTVYALNLCREKEMKEPPQPIQQSQNVATTQENKVEETATTENTTNETITETNTTTEKVTYTFKNLEGIYKGKNTVKGVDNKKYKIDVELTLFGNGMYRLEELGDAAFGYIGNYIIDEDSVVLTAWLSHGSDAGYSFYNNNKQTQKYTIKSKDLIGNLKRTSSKVDNNILKNLSGAAQNKEKLIY